MRGAVTLRKKRSLRHLGVINTDEICCQSIQADAGSYRMVLFLNAFNMVKAPSVTVHTLHPVAT
jgi:hypothetical protein